MDQEQKNHSDYYQVMQKLLTEDIQPCTLQGIVETRKEWAIIAHHNGAYGKANEFAITSSLARQLKELHEKISKDGGRTETTAQNCSTSPETST